VVKGIVGKKREGRSAGGFNNWRSSLLVNRNVSNLGDNFEKNHDTFEQLTGGQSTTETVRSGQGSNTLYLSQAWRSASTDSLQT